MKCIYCDEDKPLDAFSLEHIFPSSIGGKLCDDFFKTRSVCGDCNSRSGVAIDGPFLKGALNKNLYAKSLMDFVDPEALNTWAPFFYKGRLQSLEFGEGEVCEMWEGANGEHVYHIRDEDSAAFDTYAGGNPVKRRKVPGRAYLFLTSVHEGKSAFTIRSFAQQFKTAQRYAGNFTLAEGDVKAVVPLPEELQEEFAKIRAGAMSGLPWSLSMAIDINANERFLTKLARALGCKLFGDAYADSVYGQRVRAAMHERDLLKRHELAEYLTSTPNLKQVARFFHIAGAYSIHLLAIDTGFVLGLILPNGEALYVTLSNDSALWSGTEFDAYRSGVAYVVAHGANFFSGPIKAHDFIAHTTGVALLPDLERLERRRFGVVKPVTHQFTSLEGD
ncbi:HNH endonuclease [Pseudoduganella violacea]|uniref:HNH endonuclease 5 domain-containing protein n=1 Tax=Pseudoduganella violacea TaxID=1715466 RepID=A0A7W5FTQ4_9BURK|nr:HNH endonuclease [Pseudoduganella violacea]MBB3119014.1 hypothetical protein [Pseudoduganella violacea]